ncbi:Six-hairpin glycosidase-like protein [Mycena crocata]|nr:Six-hairpin glycosidase-like protein [Mycena crocata]
MLRPTKIKMRRPLQAVCFVAAASRISAQALSAADVSTVTTRLAEGALLSWELGARAQALLDLNVPNFSVFSAAAVPPASSIPSNTTTPIAPVFSIAHNVVNELKNVSSAASGGATALVANDGAAGDPPSIGVAVLLANWTGQGSADGLDYAGAARGQLEYTLNVVPRTKDGAISHRAAQVQLWSDSVYMVPPFLAYYGVMTANKTLISEAYNQIKLYRNYLRNGKEADGLWKHIVLGTDSADGANDEGHWSTGNGWAAAGMLRVLATMKNSPYAKDFNNQQKDLGNWVKEIHSAMFANIDSTNIFTNYADKTINETGSFYDAASTALIASTVYRVAVLWNDHSHLPAAEKCRQALFATSSASPSSASASSSLPTSSRAESARPSGSGSAASSPAASSTAPAPSASATASLVDLVHFTSNGWLQPVVNPHQFGVEGKESAEGQAFVLELQAAYSEWVAGGSVGANGARRTATPAWMSGWVWVTACALTGGLLAFA